MAARPGPGFGLDRLWCEPVRLGCGRRVGRACGRRRHLLDAEISRRSDNPFPVGILVVNLLGSFLLGLVAGSTIHGQALVIVAGGVIGSFTTFSTWMLDTHLLASADLAKLAWLNVAISLASASPRSRSARRSPEPGRPRRRRAARRPPFETARVLSPACRAPLEPPATGSSRASWPFGPGSVVDARRDHELVTTKAGQHRRFHRRGRGQTPPHSPETRAGAEPAGRVDGATGQRNQDQADDTERESDRQRSPVLDRTDAEGNRKHSQNQQEGTEALDHAAGEVAAQQRADRHRTVVGGAPFVFQQTLGQQSAEDTTGELGEDV